MSNPVRLLKKTVEQLREAEEVSRKEAIAKKGSVTGDYASGRASALAQCRVVLQGVISKLLVK